MSFSLYYNNISFHVDLEGSAALAIFFFSIKTSSFTEPVVVPWQPVCDGSFIFFA